MYLSLDNVVALDLFSFAPGRAGALFARESRDGDEREPATDA